ncbi:MAG: glycosyl hydrolase 108 family protein [Bacteroidales bacterium]|jgi:lysozyme family protein
MWRYQFDKTAMHILGKGDIIIAYRDKIWRLNYDKNTKKILNDIITTLQISFAESYTIHNLIDSIKNQRPDVLVGHLHNNELKISNDEFNFGRQSHLLSKVIKELNIYRADYMSHDEVYQSIFPNPFNSSDLYLYHGTSSVNCPGILRYGLKAGEAETNYPSISHPPIEHYDKIFLTENISKAGNHALNAVHQHKGFPVVFKFKIPDPALLIPDYDISFMSEQPTNNYTFYQEKTKSDPKIVESPEQFSKQVGTYGYKGRIPANFITSILVQTNRNDAGVYIPSNWTEITSRQLETALDMGQVEGIYYEPEDEENICPKCGYEQDWCECEQSSDNEVPVKLKTAQSQKGKSEMFMFHDIDRYISDDVLVTVAFQETNERLSIGMFSTNTKIGVAGFQEYWHYPKNDRKQAMSTYNSICTIVSDLTDEMTYNAVSHALIAPFLRKRVDKIDPEHKEKSGVYFYNWYLTNTEHEDDWRVTLYGTRYPKPHEPDVIQWTIPEQSSIQTMGKDRNRMYQIVRTAEKPYLGFLLGLSPGLIGAFLLWLSQTKNISADQIIQDATENPQQTLQFVDEFKKEHFGLNYPNKIVENDDDPNFTRALSTVLDFEGGYVKNRVEESFRGVRRNTYKDYLTQNKLPTNRINMRAIPDEHIVDIYKSMYWEASGASQLPYNVALQVFDFAVNSGKSRAVKYLQKLVGASVDGHFGPDTKNKVERYIQNHGEQSLAKAYLDAREQFVKNHVPADFRNGVLNRVESMREFLSAKNMPINPNVSQIRSKNPPPSYIYPFFSNQVHVLNDGKSEAKEMPFPVDIPYENQSTGSGAYRIDQRMTDDTAQNQKQMYPQSQWLGSGNIGAAIECKPGFACKYTDDPDEVEAAQKARKIQKQQLQNGIVQIHEIKQIQTNPDLWCIVADLVKTLNPEERQNFHIVSHSLKKYPDQQDRYKFYEKSGFQHLKAIDNKVYDMYTRLRTHGFHDDDTHGKNVGWDRNGDLVLFDLGFALYGKKGDFFEQLRTEHNPTWRKTPDISETKSHPITRTFVSPTDSTKTMPTTAQTKNMPLDPNAHQYDPFTQRLTRHKNVVYTPYGAIPQRQDPDEIQQLYSGVHVSMSPDVAAMYANNKATPEDPPVVIELATWQHWEPDVDALELYIDHIYETIRSIPGLAENIKQFEKNKQIDWKYVRDVFDEIALTDDYDFAEPENSNDVNDTISNNAQNNRVSDVSQFFKLFYREENPQQQLLGFQAPRYLVGFYEWLLVPVLTGKGTIDARIRGWYMNQMRFMSPIEEDKILAIYKVTPYNTEIVDRFGEDETDDEFSEVDEQGRERITLDEISYWSPRKTLIWESPNAERIRSTKIPVYYHGTTQRRAKQALNGISDIYATTVEMVLKHGCNWGIISNDLRQLSLPKSVIASINHIFLKKFSTTTI